MWFCFHVYSHLFLELFDWVIHIGNFYFLINFYVLVYPIFSLPQDGEVDNLPIWPVIYYCLRCGDLDAIATAVRGAS